MSDDKKAADPTDKASEIDDAAMEDVQGGFSNLTLKRGVVTKTDVKTTLDLAGAELDTDALKGGKTKMPDPFSGI